MRSSPPVVEKVHGTTRLIADPALITWLEVQTICYTIAGLVGTLIGSWISSQLGVI